MGLQVYVEQVEQGEGVLQIVVEQVEQGQVVCPAEPLNLLQSGSTRPWTVLQSQSDVHQTTDKDVPLTPIFFCYSPFVEDETRKSELRVDLNPSKTKSIKMLGSKRED